MSNGPSLGPSCQRCRAGQTVEDVPGGSIARYSMASFESSGSALWADLPDRYPSYQTCHRRFQHWARAGLLRSILEILARALPTRLIGDNAYESDRLDAALAQRGGS